MKNRQKIADTQWDAVQTEIRELIIETAQAKQLITYSELTGMLQTAYMHYHSHILTRMLIEIGSAERAAGRPLLPALVISKQSGRPGSGYFSLAPGETEASDVILEWEQEVQRVYHYWSQA
ncbi:MAG: hypothetical protein ABI690_06040 [Chloroflexota bacterium]